MGVRPQRAIRRRNIGAAGAWLLTACGSAPVASVPAEDGQGSLLLRESASGLVAQAFEGRAWELEIPADEEGRVAWLGLDQPLDALGLRTGRIEVLNEAGSGLTLGQDLQAQRIFEGQWAQGELRNWLERSELPLWLAGVSVQTTSPCPTRWTIDVVHTRGTIETVLTDGTVITRGPEGPVRVRADQTSPPEPLELLPPSPVGMTFREDFAVAEDFTRIYTYRGDGKYELFASSEVEGAPDAELSDFVSLGENLLVATDDRSTLVRAWRNEGRWEAFYEAQQPRGDLYFDPLRQELWNSRYILDDGLYVDFIDPDLSGRGEAVDVDFGGLQGLVGIRGLRRTSAGLLAGATGSGLVLQLSDQGEWRLVGLPSPLSSATSVAEIAAGLISIVSSQALNIYRPRSNESWQLVCPEERLSFNRPFSLLAASGALVGQLDDQVVRLIPEGASW